MVYDIITVRGTGEPYRGPDNMLSFVTRKLDPARHRMLDDCDYPASVGVANERGDIFGPSETDSVKAGITNLVALIRSTPNLVGLLGYSLGGVVVSRFLEAKAQGLYEDCEIAWAGFVANPNRAPGESIDLGSIGYGINGAHGPWPSLPTFTAANPADGITSCPAHSPLRAMADTMSAFSFAALGGWSMNLVARLLEHQFQPVGEVDPVAAARLDYNAAALVRGYLFDGQHTRIYVQGGYCDRLAAAINAL
jgi:hypothetical protein